MCVRSNICIYFELTCKWCTTKLAVMGEQSESVNIEYKV